MRLLAAIYKSALRCRLAVLIMSGTNMPRPPNLPRLTKKSPAVVLLRSMLERGAIGQDDEPADVHASQELFRQYPLSSFRTCFNNQKREFFNGTFIQHYFIVHSTLL